jgi:hypothetical protein
MVFSYTISDRISFGNKKAVFVNLNNVQTDGSSTFKIGDTTLAVKATNNTDSSDTFKEFVGPATTQSTRNSVTFTSATNDDDGMALIIFN